MKPINKFICLFLTILCWMSATGSAQFSIRGFVRNPNSAPIAGVSIVHHSGGAARSTTISDSTGFFTLPIQSNSGNIIFSFKRFEPFIFKVELLDADTLLNVTMTPTPTIYPDYILTGLSEQRSQSEIPYRSTILFSNKTSNPLQFAFSRELFFAESPSVLFRNTHDRTNQHHISINGLPSRYTSILENGIPVESSVGFPLYLEFAPLLGYEQIEFIQGNSINSNSTSSSGSLNFISKTYSFQPTQQIQSSFADKHSWNTSLFTSSTASYGGWNVLGSFSRNPILTSSVDFSESLFLKNTFFLEGEFSQFAITPSVVLNREAADNRVSLLGLSAQAIIGDESSGHSSINTSVFSSNITNQQQQSYNRIFVFTEMKWNGYDDFARYIAGISAQNISITGIENLPQYVNFGYPQISLFVQLDNNLNDDLFWLGSFRWTAVNSLAPLFTCNAAIQNITDSYSFGLSGQFSSIPVSLYEPEFSAFDLSRFQPKAEKLYSETMLGFSVYSQTIIRKSGYDLIAKLSFDYFYLTNPVYADHIVNTSPLGEVISEEWKLFQRDVYQDYPSFSEHVELRSDKFEIHHDFRFHFLKDAAAEFPVLYLPNRVLTHTFIFPIKNMTFKMSHSWKGNQWIPESFGHIETPSYSVLDAEISYGINYLTVFVNGFNLTNSRQPDELPSFYFYENTLLKKNNRTWGANRSQTILVGLSLTL